MDAVDINLFQFDWDLTWAAFFMNAHGHIYARYGIRKAGPSDALMTSAGLKDALRRVLEAHKTEKDRKPAEWTPQLAKDLPSLRNDKKAPKNCIHCHHVGTYRRKDEIAAGRWKKQDDVWVYPLPENVGLELDLDRNTVVKGATGAAAKAGIKTGDQILSLNGRSVITPADISWVLHNFTSESLKVDLDRGGKKQSVALNLQGRDWRKTDISWRESMWSIAPQSGFWGPDLKDDEKKSLGLAPNAVAIRINFLLSGECMATAGAKQGDVIISIDGKTEGMTARQVQTYIRLEHNPGDILKLVVLRQKKPQDLDVKLK